jgi:hypothetical protein
VENAQLADGLDVATYAEQGFLVLREVFTRPEMKSYVQGWLRLKVGLQSNSLPLKRRDRFVLGILPDPLGSIYRHPRLVEVANRILGPDVALYYNRLLVKDEVWSGSVEMHQDMPYFHGSTGKLSVFVPLEPFNQTTGGLMIVTGSHKFGNLGMRGTILPDRFPALPVAAPSLEPGDVLLMTFLTWHTSDAPTVARDRPVLQIIYQPADDGSYFNDGLDGPTLVSGQWRTSHFVRFGDGIAPDAPAASRPADPSTAT